MLETIHATGPVAAFQASGTLTGADYERLIAELENQLQQHERVAIFADVSGLHGLTFDALTRDLRYGASKLGELSRFARVAVVSDHTWMRAWTRFAWSLAPRAQVRNFPSRERDAALAWASELPAQPVRRGLRWIETNRANTYGMVWNGTVTDQDMEEALKRLEPQLEAQDRVRFLVRVEKLGGVRPHALFQRALVRLKTLGFEKVERYAIVGGPQWFTRYAHVVQRLTGIEVRHYSLAQEAGAWTWLEAQPREASTSGAAADSGDAHPPN